MRIRKFTSAILLCAAALALASCVFEKPVFIFGLHAPPAAWAGMWKTLTKDGEQETAVFFPLQGSRWILHYPANDDGFYFEAQAVKCRSQQLLQLRLLADDKGKVPDKGSDIYTLAWIEPRADGSLSVRCLNGSPIYQAGMKPSALAKLLSAPGTDWNPLFGEATTFRKK